MAAGIVAALASAAGGLTIAGATYWFTKQRDREAELRKEKLGYYKEFTASLSGILGAEGTAEGQRRFAKACNDLNLVAARPVLETLQAFQDEIRVGNAAGSQDQHDHLLSALFSAIRRDLRIPPGDDEGSLRLRLWASGQPAGADKCANG